MTSPYAAIETPLKWECFKMKGRYEAAKGRPGRIVTLKAVKKAADRSRRQDTRSGGGLNRLGPRISSYGCEGIRKLRRWLSGFPTYHRLRLPNGYACNHVRLDPIFRWNNPTARTPTKG